MSRDSSSDPTLPPPGYPESAALKHPENVGAYRIVRVIGEGGMGVVYEAVQVEPIRRRVALKMMKVGMDTREVVIRFEAERQALAVMDHPNIAKVLDAGVSEAGRPYFVMEFVPGVPLGKYCDVHKLTTRARLELFTSICQGVQHAHQKGVIHRDLKPSNVLVTEQDGHAVPKIIDFGIAKAIGQQLTERTLVTAFGYALGTPAYMSPEQAEAADLVDTRSDVYALGVLLYELLVGRLPVDPDDIGIQAFIVQLVMRETDAPTPSVRMSQLGGDLHHVADVRSTDPHSLRKEVKGDLDCILMKAMEKDRNRRYQTAVGLANDIHRYLSDEPIAARPPSARYRVGKFVRRHRASVVFATTLVLVILAFATTMTVQAGVIARERDRAGQEAAKAQAVNSFMEETLLAPDPIEGLGRDVTVVEALADATAELDRAFPGQPEVEATARSGAIGWAFFQLGKYDEAEPLLRESLRIRRAVLAPEHPDIAESLQQWARVHRVRTQYDSAEALFREALRMRVEALGPEHPSVAESLEHLGIMLGELGRYEEAQAVFEEALAIQRGQNADSLAIVDLENQLGVLLWNQGDYERLEPIWQEMLNTRRALLGPEHPLVAESMNNLAVLYDNTGRTADAERHYREALAIMRKTLGPEHEEVSAAMANLAILLDTKGEYDEAERLYREALRIDRQQLGNDNPAVASDQVNLAAMFCEIDRADEALPLLEEAIETFTASLEPGNWRIGNTYQWKGHCLTKLGRFAEAERDFEVGLQMMIAALGEDHSRVDRVRSRMAALYDAWGKPDKAAAYR